MLKRGAAFFTVVGVRHAVGRKAPLPFASIVRHCSALGTMAAPLLERLLAERVAEHETRMVRALLATGVTDTRHLAGAVAGDPREVLGLLLCEPPAPLPAAWVESMKDIQEIIAQAASLGVGGRGPSEHPMLDNLIVVTERVKRQRLAAMRVQQLAPPA